MTWSGSAEGGFVEFRLSRASRPAIRDSKVWTKARMAARTSVGVLAQRFSGNGGGAFTPSDVIEKARGRKSLFLL